MNFQELAEEIARAALDALDLSGGGCGYSNCYSVDWGASQKDISAVVLEILNESGLSCHGAGRESGR